MSYESIFHSSFDIVHLPFTTVEGALQGHLPSDRTQNEKWEMRNDKWKMI